MCETFGTKTHCINVYIMTLIVEDVRNDGAFHLVRRVVRASRLNLVVFNVNARVRRRSTAVAGLGARLAQSAVGEGATRAATRQRLGRPRPAPAEIARALKRTNSALLAHS